MIHIFYERDRHFLTARGHANYAPVGQDIVCAAVSALLYALIIALREQEENGTCRVREIAFSKGWADIAAEGAVDDAFALILGGLQQLQLRYPNCVSVEER
jgi:uncharacterized protein YsxB (DUF464 family)